MTRWQAKWLLAAPHRLAFFMPLFFAGFLFTAGPKWLGLKEVTASSLLRALCMMLIGWLIAIFGYHFNATIAGAAAPKPGARPRPRQPGPPRWSAGPSDMATGSAGPDQTDDPVSPTPVARHDQLPQTF
jgi:hypothetical protein